MANKTLKARIVLKHDSEANWDLATTFKPLKGEMIVYDTDANHSMPRIKIGDDENVPKNLPFLFEVAANTDIDSLF